MRSGFQRVLFSVAVAAAVTFVGVIPLAQASGFYKENPAYSGENTGVLTFSGAILFALTVALVGPLLKMGTATIAALKQARSRPAPVVCLTLIGCGTLCVISSLWLSWSARTIKIETGMRPAIEATSSLGPMVLTLAAFVMGSILIALGVWASLDAHSQSHAAFPNGVMKAPVPELADMPS